MVQQNYRKIFLHEMSQRILSNQAAKDQETISIMNTQWAGCQPLRFFRLDSDQEVKTSLANCRFNAV